MRYDPKHCHSLKVQVMAMIWSINSIALCMPSGNDALNYLKCHYVSFMIYGNSLLQLHWLDLYGNRRYFVTLGPNQRRAINTYANTKWVAVDESSQKLFLMNGNRHYLTRRNDESYRGDVVITVPGLFPKFHKIVFTMLYGFVSMSSIVATAASIPEQSFSILFDVQLSCPYQPSTQLCVYLRLLFLCVTAILNAACVACVVTSKLLEKTLSMILRKWILPASFI